MPKNLKGKILLIILFGVMLIPVFSQPQMLLYEAEKTHHEFALAHDEWATHINNNPFIINVKERKQWEELKKKMHTFEKAQDNYYNGN